MKITMQYIGKNEDGDEIESNLNLSKDEEIYQVYSVENDYDHEEYYCGENFKEAVAKFKECVEGFFDNLKAQ